MSLAVCEIVAFQQPSLPPRSGFYSLRPIGIGTPCVESLTGYITRLAQEHCVSVYALLTNELVVRTALSIDQSKRGLKEHSRCPHCSETQPVPFRQARLAYCSKCRIHLGGDSGKRGSGNPASDDQLWVANAVGEMLAASEDSQVPNGRLPEALRVALQQVNANESLAATAGRWGRKPVTVRAWLNGKRTPQLGSLLEICRTFDTSPLLLLTLEQARTQSDRTATVCAEAGRPGNWTSHRTINLKELKSKLEAVLPSGGDVPLSLAEVCRRLGYGRDLIYRHFPERCRAISQSHARWRAKRSARRKRVLSNEVRRIAVSLHEAGREPTLREVASRLTTPGSMRERIAREVLAQIRLELGPVRH